MSNDADFKDLMSGFLRRAEKIAVPDLKTRTAMTTAGAKILAEDLKKKTPRTGRKNVKYGHLQDNVTYESTDIDGERNGSSVVGFGKKAYVARFLNDGTVKMKATHFVDNARREAADKVFAAQKAIFDASQRGDD